MSIKISCREATRLLLQAQDRPLSLADRLRARLHLWMCTGCARFDRQVQLMQQATARWRQYRDD